MAFVKNHIPWAIKLKNYPEVRGDLTYNGKNQSPVWNYFNPDEVEIVGGTASAVNAGTYTIQFKPRMKYVFPNGTKKIYSTTWTINKANNVVSLSESTGDVKIKFTRRFTVSRLGDGAISATSRNPSIATVSVSGNVVTVTGVGVGQAVIDIKIAEGTNYFAAQTTYVARSSKTKITIPTVSDTSFTYSGSRYDPTKKSPAGLLLAGGFTSIIIAQLI